MAFKNYYIAKTWDDITASLIGRTLSSASGSVAYNWAENAVAFSPNGSIANTADIININYQYPHSAVKDGVMAFHIHWEQPSASEYLFDYKYRVQSNGEAKTTTWQTGQASSNNSAFPYVGGTLNQITPIVTIDMNGFALSSTIQIQFTRVDAVAGDINVVFADCHAQSDTNGSRLQYIK